MTTAANLLNAVGGAPSIDQPAFIPSWPLEIPLINQVLPPLLITPSFQLLPLLILIQDSPSAFISRSVPLKQILSVILPLLPAPSLCPQPSKGPLVKHNSHLMWCDVWVWASALQPHTHTITHSHTLIIICTCCCDGIKGIQDQDFSYSFSDSPSAPSLPL